MLPDLNLPELNINENKEEEKNILKESVDVALGPAPNSQFGATNQWTSTGWIGNFHIDRVLSYAIIDGASDVHINPNQEISFTIIGDIVHFGSEIFPIPDSEILFTLVENVLSAVAMGKYNVEKDMDWAYVIRYGPYKGRRFRVSVGGGITADEHFLCLRVINDKIPSLTELHVDNEIVTWSNMSNGLFLICGTTGSGKSTTLASVLREVQITQPRKIITIERPVEYIYPKNGKGLVVQREVGIGCDSFNSGLTGAMRQNPDIILLGEVRNKEEINELLRAAETGHLAISTMHTYSVANTVNRVLTTFSAEEKDLIMSTFSDSVRGLCNQVLVKDGKGGRFAVREILTVNNDVKKLLAKGDIQGIRKYQLENEITMENKLAKLMLDDKITEEEARKHITNVDDFDTILERYGW